MHFSHVFEDDVELLRYPRLTLHLEVEGSDDADVFAKLSKVTAQGEVLGIQLLPPRWGANAEVAGEIAEIAQGHLRSLYYYDGPWARLRASHRAQDKARAAVVPYHTHDSKDRSQPGQVVEMELGFIAIGMRFRRGGILRLTVGGINTAVWAAPDITQPEFRN